jgi:hypothetical protein
VIVKTQLKGRHGSRHNREYHCRSISSLLAVAERGNGGQINQPAASTKHHHLLGFFTNFLIAAQFAEPAAAQRGYADGWTADGEDQRRCHTKGQINEGHYVKNANTRWIVSYLIKEGAHM